MSGLNPIEPVQALAERVIAAVGLELVQVELKGQGAGRVLRVVIDQPGGVGLSECERASHALSARLDPAGEDLLPGPYTLEVSSPGLDRPLVKPGDFTRFAGQRVHLRTRVPVGSSRNFTGILQGAGNDGVHLLPDAAATALTIPWDNLAQARLAPLWPQPRPGPRRGRAARARRAPEPGRR